MINKIKLYEVSVKRGFNGAKTYTKKDITKQMEIPFNDTCQRNGVLDTSSISILKKDKTPLNPLTRIIFELYDDKDNGAITEKIYRVVDVDNVSNAVRGNIPLYRHSIMLIEPTKILERRSCDNLSFTNFLTANLSTNFPIQMQKGKLTILEDSNYTAETVLNNYTYSGSARLLGPYHLLGSEDTISVDFKVNLKCQYSSSFFGIPCKPIHVVDMDLVDFYVVSPNGTKKSLIDKTSFTYEAEGYYTFYQIYRYYSYYPGGEYREIEHGVTQEVYWQVNCVRAIPLITHTYSIRQAIERLLQTHKVLRSSIDSKEFFLDDAVAKNLDIPAPEFTITEGTLFEALCQIGNYAHAIPRLVPDVRGNDDYSNWNKITFDFLDDGNEIQKGTYSLVDMENPTEEYAESFVSNVQNATTTNYSNKPTQIEPYNGGFLSTRTESSIFEISDKDCVFKTKLPIREILRATILYNGKTLDITNNIVEEAKYKLKSQYEGGVAEELKNYYLYYKEGNNNIYGLSFVATSKGDMAFTKRESLKNIISAMGGDVDSVQLKDVAINIEYVPWVAFKARQYKTHLDSSIEQSTLFYNQQANEVDIDAYGENMHYALVRTGNVKLSKTQYFYSLKNIPKCGDYFIEDGSKWVAFQVNRELSFGAPIKVTIAWAKDYNELYAEIAVKKAIRQFEIAEKGIHNRNIDIQEFCVVGTSLDCEREIDCKLPGFGNNNNISSICRYLNGDNVDRLVSIAACEVVTDIIKTEEGTRYDLEHFFLPTSVYTFGRSIVFYFSMDDNYSAGTYANNTIAENNTYAIEEYIPYCNQYGRAELLDYIFQKNIEIENSIYNSYKIEYEEYANAFYNACATWSIGDGNSIILSKDSRERISVTTQLNFVSFESNIEIYKAFVNTMPYMADGRTRYKIVVFKEKQLKTSDKIQGEYISLGEVQAEEIPQSSAIKINIPTAEISGVGYGIITYDERLCVYVEENIWTTKTLKPIYLMYRNKI